MFYHIKGSLSARAIPLVITLLAAWLPVAHASHGPLKAGDRAPDFSLPAHDGSKVSLKDFLGKKLVVVYFYPKDDTLVCKKEACLFRDKYEAFSEAGAEVVGISSDSVESHKNFVQARKLPFKLLSDRGGKVRKLYQVPRTAMGMLPGRETFVIDREGLVQLRFKSLLNADEHVNEALRVLKTLEAKQANSSVKD